MGQALGNSKARLPKNPGRGHSKGCEQKSSSCSESVRAAIWGAQQPWHPPPALTLPLLVPRTPLCLCGCSFLFPGCLRYLASLVGIFCPWRKNRNALLFHKAYLDPFLWITLISMWKWTTNPTRASGRALPPAFNSSSLPLEGVQLFVKSHQK